LAEGGAGDWAGWQGTGVFVLWQQEAFTGLDRYALACGSKTLHAPGGSTRITLVAIATRAREVAFITFKYTGLAQKVVSDLP
jgi:hypothetical protein